MDFSPSLSLYLITTHSRNYSLTENKWRQKCHCPPTLGLSLFSFLLLLGKTAAGWNCRSVKMLLLFAMPARGSLLHVITSGVTPKFPQSIDRVLLWWWTQMTQHSHKLQVLTPRHAASGWSRIWALDWCHGRGPVNVLGSFFNWL